MVLHKDLDRAIKLIREGTEESNQTALDIVGDHLRKTKDSQTDEENAFVQLRGAIGRYDQMLSGFLQDKRNNKVIPAPQREQIITFLNDAKTALDEAVVHAQKIVEAVAKEG